MTRFSAVTTLLCLFFGNALMTFAQDSSPEEPSPAEQAIRQSIDSYVKVFNSGDAKSLAAHWNKGGEFVTADGKTLQGRKAIEADFAEYFQSKKDVKLELLETQLTFLSPNVAVETGLARIVTPEQEPVETMYEAIHLKSPTGWKIDSISEQAPPDEPKSHHQHLASMEWMIGSWKESSGDSVIENNCRWTTNQNFLVHSFKVIEGDQVDFEGTQVVGWDPHRKSIRSWIFDSDGGFGVGSWSQEESRWVVRTLSVLPDGRRGSATNIYEKVDENSFRFRSIGRQVDGQLMPSIESVTLSRIAE
ncbi:MAG: SgcJ/EcaC family oxidoreductase [Lacipirellulaceae bacterium]